MSAALVSGGGFCYNSRMKTTLVFTATLVATFVSFAETISEKSPDGRNEIRLTTEPVLSYSVLHDGKERVASTPISLTVEGKGVLGGKVKVVETARVPHAGKLATPIYKKASVNDNGNETNVATSVAVKTSVVFMRLL